MNPSKVRDISVFISCLVGFDQYCDGTIEGSFPIYERKDGIFAKLVYSQRAREELQVKL